ncbi:DUF4184 family protein [Streptomyces sp. SCSIO 30461]|uniref:DUF4184 family protein n=1 Tax=Streptomyces sp. SCSIO 30461 TaxID=3118085 RepID=UPI0030CBB1F1
MPFTLSHAAAVLPGIRRDGSTRGPLLASALIAGSFAPDMTYFVASLHPDAMLFGDVTHSIKGVLTVDVVITAALVGLWVLVRDPLVALLPHGRQGRVHALLCGPTRVRRSPAARMFVFYVSAVLGAATHVVWDSFTHFDRWGVRAAPVLSEPVAGFPLYLYTQYGSSAVALVVIAWFTVSALRRVPVRLPVPAGLPVLGSGERLTAGMLITVCVLAATAHRCLRFYWYWGRIDTLMDIIPTACFGAGAGLVAGIVLYALAVRLRPCRAVPADAPEKARADGAGVS